MFSFFRRKKKAEPVAPLEPEVAPPSAVVAAVATKVPALEPTPPRREESPEIAALRARSPEELCGITAGMAREEIHARLAQLFRRHNRAASSLDARLRAEAEIFLHALVDLRHRYLDAPE